MLENTPRPTDRPSDAHPHDSRQTHPRPPRKPAHDRLRRAARQHGRQRVQGIHLWHLVFEARQRPVRPAPGRHPPASPSRRADRGRHPATAGRPRPILRPLLLRPQTRPLEHPLGRSHTRQRRQAGGHPAPRTEARQRKRRLRAQQSLGSPGRRQPRRPARRAERHHQLQPQNWPDHAGRRHPGRFHSELRQDPAQRQRL